MHACVHVSVCVCVCVCVGGVHMCVCTHINTSSSSNEHCCVISELVEMNGQYIRCRDRLSEHSSISLLIEKQVDILKGPIDTSPQCAHIYIDCMVIIRYYGKRIFNVEIFCTSST